MSNNKIINKDNLNTITDVIKDTALSCIGVFAIANKEEIKKSMMKGKAENGIEVYVHSDQTLSISVYLIMSHGLKIAESLRECQKQLYYVLKKQGCKIRNIDLYAVSLKA